MRTSRFSVVTTEARAVPGPAKIGTGGLEVALRVIRAEIGGLQSLAAALDDGFEKAVAACAAARGRIIVTGIGKSGHVARKIALIP